MDIREEVAFQSLLHRMGFRRYRMKFHPRSIAIRMLASLSFKLRLLVALLFLMKQLLLEDSHEVVAFQSLLHRMGFGQHHMMNHLRSIAIRMLA